MTTNPTHRQPPPTSHTTSNVTKVTRILKDLRHASLRPLYAEVALHKQRVSSHYDDPLLRNYEDDPNNDTTTPYENSSGCDRAWVEILDDAILMTSYLSDDDHGEVLRLCSIYLLAFLLPYSTGMDYYFTETMTIDDNNIDDQFSVDEYIILMPLEERLTKAAVRCSPFNNDRYGTCDEFTLMDQDVELALGDLLERFCTLLQRRSVHTHQVDLLHLLAIIIHPCHTQTSISESIIDPTTATANSNSNSPAWAKAKRLMETSIGLQFQIHYGHRRQIVQMISECVLIQAGINDYVPLYTGAIPHLFASLRQFCCHTSEDQLDSHLALKSIVALAVQCRPKNSDDKQSDARFVQSTYDWLINRMMEECGDSCCHGHSMELCVNAKNGTTLPQNESSTFCTYYARGEALSDLIVLYCQSQQDVNMPFMSNILHSLSELIEWQVDNWIVNLSDETTFQSRDRSPKKSYSPCLLASMLLVATKWFYFLVTLKKNITETAAEDNPCALLIRCCISMLQHPDHSIVIAASQLLVHALIKKKVRKRDQIFSLLCGNITSSTIQKNKTASLMTSLVAVVSGRSYSAAEYLFNYISPCLRQNLDDNYEENKKQKVMSLDEASAWLVAISMNCPDISSKHHASLLLIVEDNKVSSEDRCQATKSVLCSRLTHYFLNNTDFKVSSTVETFLSSTCKDDLVRYKMGRHALVSGHFGLAHKLFKLVLVECEHMDTTHYLWMSILEHVSYAESILSTVPDPKSSLGSVIGIPDASTKLYSAVSYMETLRKTCSIWACGGAFQLRFLLLRLDLLDLVALLRHLTRERRLTGKSPLKGTRSYWHLHNVVKSFDALARRYQGLYREYGMCFKHSQSITSLAMLQSLSSLMAVVARVCYSDVFMPSKSTTMNTSYFQVDDNIIHPMASLTRQLYELVVNPMIGVETIDYRIRAAATLELIDGIILVPFPVPRDFFAPRPYCIPELLLSADPNPVYKEHDAALTIIESAPSIGFSFYVSGCVAVQYLNASRLPVVMILLWFQIKHVGPLTLDDEDSNDMHGADHISNDDEPSSSNVLMKEVPIPDLSMISPAVSKISCDGYFFYEVQCPPLNVEGNYTLCSKLGCRDVNGNDWEIPGCHRSIPIQVCRSRSILY